MPKGGLRIGQGRRPAPRGAVYSMDGFSARLGVAGGLGPVPQVDGSVLADPPDGVGERAAELWRELAPHAIAQGTLVPATVQGFRELVEHVAMKQELVAKIVQAGGAAAKDADGLMRHYAKIAQRLDASLARFRLTASGKPEPSAVRVKVANPWAAVASK